MGPGPGHGRSDPLVTPVPATFVTTLLDDPGDFPSDTDDTFPT